MASATQVVLGLFLQGLGIEIPELKDRHIRVITQKSVYLTQYGGFDIGYRFRWSDHNGPYCDPLWNDCSILKDIHTANPSFLEDKALHEKHQATLGRFREQLIPRESNLWDHEWLTLIGTYHFLLKISGYTPEESQETIKKYMPKLFPHIEHAKTSLEKMGIM